jgi:methionyl-tRNA synthetase
MKKTAAYATMAIMEARKANFYITTPIYYPNAEPHLGHAYTTLLCDGLTRFHRLMGEETYFLTGTDENTQKVIQSAEKAGKDPHVYLEEIVSRFKHLYDELGISYSQFIRTSDSSLHWPGAIEFWQRLEANGDLYKGEYVGLYCVGCEAFKTEKDLVDGKCPNHDTKPLELKEENYFFRLSSYTDEIKKLIESDEILITPASRKNEIINFIEGGLDDISFSRPAKEVAWGIPVPNDESQKMYVWMDALTNYITALGFGRDEENMKFWPGVHVVGKDILRFHAVIWPAMLLSASISLPKEIYVHGMLISDGKKMSKSLGNVISPFEMIERYGRDASRYLLLRHVHPFDDTDITWERLDEWYTANLVNGLGNLVSRVMKMAETHLDAPIERPMVADFDPVFLHALDSYNFQSACDLIWKKVGDLDERIATTEPFKLIKEDKTAGQTLIAELVRDVYLIGRLLLPIMPEANAKIKEAVLQNKKPDNLFPRLEA